MDIRVIERNLQRGTIEQKALEKSVSELPDDSANAEWISIQSLAEQDGIESR